MGELDDRFDLRFARHDHPVAQRPMAAATRSGAGGPDKRTPQDDENQKGQDKPRITREVGIIFEECRHDREL